LAQAYPEITAAGAELLVVVKQASSVVSAAKTAYALPYPMLPDPTGSVVDHYSGSLADTKAQPATYVVDPQGIVRFVKVETDGTAAATIQEILDAIEASKTPLGG
jgi:peroxiredoxin